MTTQTPVSLYDTIPSAIQPVYTTAKISEPVLVYEGPVILNDTVQAEGRVHLAFQPHPDFVFELDTTSLPLDYSGGEVRITLAGATMTGYLMSGEMGGAIPKFSGEGYFQGHKLRGYVANVVFPDSNEVSYVVFHLVNFPAYLGSQVRLDSASITQGRIVLSIGPWKITLDDVANAPKQDELIKKRGYAITHVAKLEREDGDPFCSQDLATLFDLLYYAFSFACGWDNGPYLAIGFNKLGEQVWREWNAVKSHHYKHHLSWFPAVLPSDIPNPLEQIAQALWKLRHEGLYYKPFTLAIAWYLESLASSTPETGLILAQAGLEMVTYIEIFERQKIFAKDTEQKISTSEKLGLLLTLAKIPRSFPAGLTKLKVVADDTRNNKKQWLQGHHAVVEFRNCLMHPRHRDIAFNSNGNACVEAKELALWYLELAILYVLGYQGHYNCRIQSEYSKGFPKVPWQA